MSRLFQFPRTASDSLRARTNRATAALPSDIARNLLRESYRRRSREDDLGREPRAWAPGRRLPAGVADAVAGRAVMLRVLASLPDADLEPLTLVAWHELSPADAAQVLGCSKAAFYVRLRRARRCLEHAVAAQARPDPDVPEPAVPRGRVPGLAVPERGTSLTTTRRKAATGRCRRG